MKKRFKQLLKSKKKFEIVINKLSKYRICFDAQFKIELINDIL